MTAFRGVVVWLWVCLLTGRAHSTPAPTFSSWSFDDPPSPPPTPQPTGPSPIPTPAPSQLPSFSFPTLLPTPAPTLLPSYSVSPTTPAPSADAICAETRAATPFRSIAERPAAVRMETELVDDVVYPPLTLPFAFPWLSDHAVYTIAVTSNGQLNLNGGLDDGCCDAYAIDASSYQGGFDRIAFAQEDLNPSSGGDIFFENKNTSFVVSFEGIPFWPVKGAVYAQVELYEDGDVEIRWGDGDVADVDRIAAGVESPEAGLAFPVTSKTNDAFGKDGVAKYGRWPARDGVRFVCHTTFAPTVSAAPTEMPTEMPTEVPTEVPTPPPTATPAPSSEPTPFPCPEDYVWSPFSGGVCYSPLIDSGGDWTECEAACVARNETMLCVRDAADNAFLFDTLATNTTILWIGLSDRATEGVFEWVDGCDAPGNFTAWADGEPNDRRGEDYVGMDGLRGEWNDFADNGRKSSLDCFCERPSP